MIKAISGFVCILLAVGIYYRHKKNVHLPIMITAFLIDLSLVLYLELARHVVETLPDRPMNTMLTVHIMLSTAALALYLVQFYTGIQNARGNKSEWHRKVPFAFITARFGGFVTSLLMVV